MNKVQVLKDSKQYGDIMNVKSVQGSFYDYIEQRVYLLSNFQLLAFDASLKSIGKNVTINVDPKNKCLTLL